jgi:curved DNA-binding protein CbpA
MKSFYDILGVSKFASDVEIKKAYILRSKMMHPDRFNQTSQKDEWAMANEMLKELNHAYGVLKDPVSRSIFDRTMEGVHSNQSAPTPQSSTSYSQPPRREAEPPPMPKKPKYTAPPPAKGVDMPEWIYKIFCFVVGFAVIALIGKGCDSAKNKAPSTPSNLSAGASYPATPRYTPFPTPVSETEKANEKLRGDIKRFNQDLENATKGDLVAANSLGHHYYNGIGTPQNYGEAVKWWHYAADRGSADSQEELGISYLNGIGVPEDRSRAYLYLALASKVKLTTTEYFQMAEKACTLAEKIEAHRLLREWSIQPHSTP